MDSLSKSIKDYALSLGFSACGIAKVQELEVEKKHLQSWLSNDSHGKMLYMGNHFEKRVNPAKLVDGAKSVVSVLLNYYNEDVEIERNTLKISKYAWGQDYHHVMKAKLFSLFDFIKSQNSEADGRAFVDSAPILDKAWAEKSGLGWIGKNTCLIRKKGGSFFFVGELVLDIELKPDELSKNHCGNCTKCIDACPTGALIAPYRMDSRKCISYLTIELKDQIPEEHRGKMQNNIFGCDICQNVCPWNKFAEKTKIEEFQPLEIIRKGDWGNIDKAKFKKAFKESPISRVKYEKFLDNIDKQN